MKQGGTNGSKEESSKEKENHKEESSKEKENHKEESKEESSKEKEKISTSIQLVFDKASCPIVFFRENKNMGLLFVCHRNSGIISQQLQLGIISVFPS